MHDVPRQTYPFALPDLPYSYDALEPHLDQMTLRIHHDKHHRTYVDKLNEAVARRPELQGLTLVELLSDIAKLPAEVREAVRNNGGGHYHHDLFWNSMSPEAARTGAQAPAGALAGAIDAAFGSLAAFREKFLDTAARHFASGWVALVRDLAGGGLALADLKDHDAPPLRERVPLLIVDVWEHAYYVKFQNRRPEFLAAFWQVVDWRKVGQRFDNSRTAAGV
jgi:superoxide dismutase, Fe-Mn family